MRLDRQSVFLGSALVTALVVVLAVMVRTPGQNETVDPTTAVASALKLEQIPFDGQRCYELLKRICDLGPRFSGSPGMLRQQQLLQEHFEKLGGQVEFQRFQVRHPLDGSPVDMANLIVHWHPDRRERILLCAHYDTRPFPDRDPDPRGRRGVFIGANDGASGTAVLGEMAHAMKPSDLPYGVDFVLLTARNWYTTRTETRIFWGRGTSPRSMPSSRRATITAPHCCWTWLVTRTCRFIRERQSSRWRDSRSIVDGIWGTARRLGVTEFVARRRHKIATTT